MQIKVSRIEDGPTRIEVIDPSDGAVAQQITLSAGEEVTIAATTADSPADIEVGEVTPSQDSAPAENAPDTAVAPDTDAGAAGGGEGQEATGPDAEAPESAIGPEDAEPGDAAA